MRRILGFGGTAEISSHISYPTRKQSRGSITQPEEPAHQDKSLATFSKDKGETAFKAVPSGFRGLRGRAPSVKTVRNVGRRGGGCPLELWHCQREAGDNTTIRALGRGNYFASCARLRVAVAFKK